MQQQTDVVAYFGDDPTRVYQVAQWLPVLEVLDRTHRVALVLRNAEVARLLEERTTLRVVLAAGFDELAKTFDNLDASVVLYCNNSRTNVDALLNNRMLHVHVNHGESDKQSMVSNNAKAYDRVFVAGEAAVRRHLAHLLEFDGSSLVRIGRPQLDVARPEALAPSSRTTVLYAPTWEGDADYNDYTSVDVLGPAIVEAVLALPDVRLVYKPHPKITTSLTPAIATHHAAIVQRVTEAAFADPTAGHAAVLEGDILAVMTGCDLMITDVSSVGLDWLYLRTDRPILVTDRHGDADALRRDVPVSRCADIIDVTNVDGLTALLAARLADDTHRAAREETRRHYFDDVRPGESTTRFVTAVTDLVALRRRLVSPDA
ncbi:CDP-glycerol glycerophosphotransferase family protein [Nocardioides stalactiti]|uniref:CDP-glycerol glycerophosphotransferase family protein n=1 Tax=Nocardioides stalactiti TaxID=2755356 RepID=UPI00160023E1|nr:CDP-glycerol glycerophosphotransferase family protein [Nocardioides stalactiti]